MSSRLQRTIKKKVAISGVGLHTGCHVTLSLLPAAAGKGIFFQRMDLPHSPLIPASVAYVVDTTRSTMVGIGDCRVQTIEHLLAAVKAAGIDNLCIQVTAGEVPILDGSALPFLLLIEEAGVEEQEELHHCKTLAAPIYYSEGNCHLIALPSEQFKISYTLFYPHAKLIGSQYFSFVLSEKNFKEQIASCRTFVLYQEIAPLIEQGLIKGGSLENAVIIKEDEIVSKEGLRYKDEMVRHKILDLIGDLSLVGFDYTAHIIAICSGHRTNVALGKEIVRHCVKGGVHEGLCRG